MKKLILTLLTLLSVACYGQDFIEPEMVFVQGGTFNMGSNERDDEKPIHSVTLSSYYIGKYEVTRKEWGAIMAREPDPSIENMPEFCVSYEDCQNFIKRLNAKTGKKYRLPTEAEWEFAARGGNKSKGYKYAGSNLLNLDKVAWIEGNASRQRHLVGKKQANELGIYDMSGNVWEWCNDYYGSYSSSPQTNPQGAVSGSERVTRGGSYMWICPSQRCRVAFRCPRFPEFYNEYLGFRLVCPI